MVTHREATRAALTTGYDIDAEQLSDDALRRVTDSLDLEAGPEPQRNAKLI